MKPKQSLALAAVAMLTFAGMAQADTMFEGTMKITATNASCTQGPPVGMTGNASFHSNTIAGNSDFSALNYFFGSIHSHSWLLNNGSFTSSFTPTIHGGIEESVWVENQPTSSFLRITSMSPSSLTSTTPSITLIGQIKNPWTISGQENCVATFRMVGILSKF